MATSLPIPVIFNWSGDAMVPLDRFRRLCDRQYVVGQEYRLDVVEERSRASHNAYFALLVEAWRNLPEDIADRFPSPTHLRKWALCKTGYANIVDYPAKGGLEEAHKLAAFVRQIDSYAVILIEDDVVRVCTAWSQSRRAMKKKMFQETKDRVLDYISSLIGTDVATLREQVLGRVRGKAAHASNEAQATPVASSEKASPRPPGEP